MIHLSFHKSYLNRFAVRGLYWKAWLSFYCSRGGLFLFSLFFPSSFSHELFSLALGNFWGLKSFVLSSFDLLALACSVGTGPCKRLLALALNSSFQRSSLSWKRCVSNQSWVSFLWVCERERERVQDVHAGVRDRRSGKNNALEVNRWQASWLTKLPVLLLGFENFLSLWRCHRLSQAKNLSLGLGGQTFPKAVER